MFLFTLLEIKNRFKVYNSFLINLNYLFYLFLNTVICSKIEQLLRNFKLKTFVSIAVSHIASNADTSIFLGAVFYFVNIAPYSIAERKITAFESMTMIKYVFDRYYIKTYAYLISSELWSEFIFKKSFYNGYRIALIVIRLSQMCLTLYIE